MDYFKERKNANQYIEMTKDYNPEEIVNRVREYLPLGASLLELGMGPGKDLVLLGKYYDVLGSDHSEVFVETFKEKGLSIPVSIVDAVTIQVDKLFDCVYSNKVLSHLTRKDFKESLTRQYEVLNDGGIIFMTLWRGEYHEECMEDVDLRFTYYEEKDIQEMMESRFELLTLEVFSEMNTNDSMLVVLKKL